MGLNPIDQVHLLKDILIAQQSDSSGTTAEYEQLERVIKSLMVNNSLDSNLKNLLDDIYRYCQSGKSAAAADHHVSKYRGSLSQWITEIDSYS